LDDFSRIACRFVVDFSWIVRRPFDLSAPRSICAIGELDLPRKADSIALNGVLPNTQSPAFSFFEGLPAA
jgi:hypothetical protein